jgi:hypothetical protein
MTVDTFYQDTSWQSSSGPYLNRMVELTDLWPEGLASEAAGGNKDVLEDGMHQFLACGAKADRPHNPVGVTVSMNETAGLVQMNFAQGFMAKAYVANVLTYSQGAAATFDQSLEAFEPVYVDDSDPLDAGVTLSRSPLNSAGDVNPQAGWIMYDQGEYADILVGGPNATAGLPKTVANELTNTLVTVMLWPDQY